MSTMYEGLTSHHLTKFLCTPTKSTPMNVEWDMESGWVEGVGGWGVGIWRNPHTKKCSNSMTKRVSQLQGCQQSWWVRRYQTRMAILPPGEEHSCSRRFADLRLCCNCQLVSCMRWVSSLKVRFSDPLLLGPPSQQSVYVPFVSSPHVPSRMHPPCDKTGRLGSHSKLMYIVLLSNNRQSTLWHSANRWQWSNLHQEYSATRYNQHFAACIVWY